jgi:hypothetical protein
MAFKLGLKAKKTFSRGMFVVMAASNFLVAS